MCVAPDGTVWSFGTTTWDKVNDRRYPGDLLRHFDFHKGELASYISNSNFPNPESSQAPSETFTRCSETAATVFSGSLERYIVMSYRSSAPQVYPVTVPSGLSLVGLATLGPRNTYGALMNRTDSGDQRQGLYSLTFDDVANAFRWTPVGDAVGARTELGTVLRVWGADGADLVVSRAKDPAGLAALQWVSVGGT